MLNVSSEQEYVHKNLLMLKKFYGFSEYEQNHENFEKMESFVIKDYNDGVKVPHRFTCDLTSSKKRHEVIKYIDKVLKETDHALCSMEVMFDYHLMPFEKESYFQDYNEVKDLLIEYCQKYNCRAVTVTHFNEYLDPANKSEGLRLKHMHIIYEQDPEVSFRTFLLGRIE